MTKPAAQKRIASARPVSPVYGISPGTCIVLRGAGFVKTDSRAKGPAHRPGAFQNRIGHPTDFSGEPPFSLCLCSLIKSGEVFRMAAVFRYPSVV